MGEDELPKVSKLTITTTRRWRTGRTHALRFTLSRPDRFEFTTGPFTHILDGGEYSRRPSASPEVIAAARGNTELNYLRTAVLFLLKVPSSLGVEVQDRGPRRLEGVVLHEVAFLKNHTTLLSLFLDPSTWRPTAYSMQQGGLQSNGAKSEALTIVGWIQTHQVVAGLRFPQRIVESYGTHEAVTEFACEVELAP